MADATEIGGSDAAGDSEYNFGFAEIDETECWKLLASKPVGRIAVIAGHYPLIFPVNYAVAARGVIFRTSPGTKLWAVPKTNVSFEVDEIDVSTHTGWSVLVRGSAREISAQNTNPELVEAITSAAPDPWAPGDRNHFVRIVVDAISGRRIQPAP